MRVLLIFVLSLTISVPVWSDPLDLGKSTTSMDAATRDNGLSYEVSCPEEASAAEACVTDKPTYLGWRTFHAHCFQCHGGSALGSTFAPNLLDRLNQHVDFERFEYVLNHGYSGRTGAMPSFEKNKQVLKNLSGIYLYLRARADDILPPGRPKPKAK